MPIDTEALLDRVEEFIQNEGKEVLSLGWDGGAPGMAGAMWVTEWHGLYFVFSSDIEEEGPFEFLDEALGCECFSVVTAQPELSSKVLKLKQLKDVALGLMKEGDTVWMNSKRFLRRGDKLVKVD